MTPTQEQERIEALLKPRYKVIADYPFNNHFKVGEILTMFKAIPDNGIPEYYYHYPVTHNNFMDTWFDQYPHLFRKLEWWEEREVEEMPEYIGCNRDGKFLWVAPVVKFTNIKNKNEPATCMISFTNLQGQYEEANQNLWSLSPATQQDYTPYLNQP